MKKTISILATAGMIIACAAVQPAWAAGFDLKLPDLTGFILNGGNEEKTTVADSAQNSSGGQSEGPAPNSGDGIADGSGMSSPNGPKK
ncbi:hypothetical protein [Chlorobium phaeobacteroides]|nr:hypothetical protein [Chlorobium phaeobacteroides]